jgi:hypothetical protein
MWQTQGQGKGQIRHFSEVLQYFLSTESICHVKRMESRRLPKGALNYQLRGRNESEGEAGTADSLILDR